MNLNGNFHGTTEFGEFEWSYNEFDCQICEFGREILYMLSLAETLSFVILGWIGLKQLNTVSLTDFIHLQRSNKITSFFENN